MSEEKILFYAERLAELVSEGKPFIECILTIFKVITKEIDGKDAVDLLLKLISTYANPVISKKEQAECVTLTIAVTIIERCLEAAGYTEGAKWVRIFGSTAQGAIVGGTLGGPLWAGMGAAFGFTSQFFYEGEADRAKKIALESYKLLKESPMLEIPSILLSRAKEKVQEVRTWLEKLEILKSKL